MSAGFYFGKLAVVTITMIELYLSDRLAGNGAGTIPESAAPAHYGCPLEFLTWSAMRSIRMANV